MKKITFLISLIIILNLIHYKFFKKYDLENPKTIVVNPGMKLNGIAKILYDEEIIDSQINFILWTKFYNEEKNLRSGEYFFHKELSVHSIIKKIVSGETILRKLTIIEGSTKFDIVEKLKLLNLNLDFHTIQIPRFLVADTYAIDVTQNIEEIFKSILNSSLEVMENIWQQRNITIPIKNSKELYILASIVEKETSIRSERRIVAGVFFNRLKKKMRLQSDPTVEYSITKGEKKLKRNLFRSDLKIPSDFNTYVNYGLPPGPISFPGIDSLKAVANPEKSNYYYFVADKSGNGHLFSKNYREHRENIKKMKMVK